MSQTLNMGTNPKSATIPSPGGYDRPTRSPESIDSFFFERGLLNIINSLKCLYIAAKKLLRLFGQFEIYCNPFLRLEILVIFLH